MRTTLSLDDDVAAQLDQLRARRSASYKEVVNEVLRAGLAHLDHETAPRPGPFTRPTPLGRPRLPEVDDISDALALAEGEDHR